MDMFIGISLPLFELLLSLAFGHFVSAERKHSSVTLKTAMASCYSICYEG